MNLSSADDRSERWLITDARPSEIADQPDIGGNHSNCTHLALTGRSSKLGRPSHTAALQALEQKTVTGRFGRQAAAF